MGSTNGAGFSTNGVFPELVIDMGPSATRTTGAVPASPLGHLVENALREVLAWRPRTSDPKGFVAALNQVFTISEKEGHTEFAWTPRSYAVQADMGAVTGAQASIFSRAKAALDQSVPLLEGLFALRSDDDKEDIEAIRAVVISKMTELVNELGQVGGPRLPRIDDYFDSLLGLGVQNDPEEVDGLFGQMRDEFGLERALINTIDEEQNLTNYLIVVDHVISLRRSWDNLRHFFDQQGTNVFLGTQLVLLSRALGVVAESVQELYFVMDSVFLGAAERQTVQLDLALNGRTYRLTIDELFTWVERFCTEEAPQLIRDGGKDGVIAFRSTVRQLQQLVTAAFDLARSSSSNPQRGFHHERTVAALEEVVNHVKRVDHLTDQLRRLPRPEIEIVTPEQVTVGNSQQQVIISGNRFQPGADVWLTRPGPDETRGPVARVTVVSPTTIIALFDLSDVEARDLVGEWTVVVKNPDGGFDVKRRALEILALDEEEATSVTPLQITEIAFRAAPRTRTFILNDEPEPDFNAEHNIARIRVTFDKRLNVDQTTLPKLFLVEREGDGTAPDEMVPGDFYVRPREITFVAHKSFSVGAYVVTLVGSESPALMAVDGSVLNGGADRTFRFLINDRSVAV
jgi:hypothetical protein